MNRHHSPFVTAAVAAALSLSSMTAWSGDLVGRVTDANTGRPLPNATVRINAGNIGDEKYINTLRYGAGYYGAPRNYTLSLDWRF